MICLRLLVSDAERGNSSISDCSHGLESCHVNNVTNASTTVVPTITVASLIYLLKQENQLSLSEQKIDILQIDTEGNDALVIFGAKGLLQIGLIRVIIFEYHHIGQWSGISLKSVATYLYGMRYICYFTGQRGRLWPISGDYWSDLYEIKMWSNVACFYKDDAWHAVIAEYVVN